MPNPSPDILLALWHQALEHEIGIAITTNDRRWLERNLYKVRQDHGTERLWDIIMFKPPNPDEIWLCKKAINLDD